MFYKHGNKKSSAKYDVKFLLNDQNYEDSSQSASSGRKRVHSVQPRQFAPSVDDTKQREGGLVSADLNLQIGNQKSKYSEGSTDSDMTLKLQVIILGDDKVGKTSLFHRYMHASSDAAKIEPTPLNQGLILKNLVHINNVYLEVTLWDFHEKIGLEKEDLVGQVNMKDALILLYDPSRPETLDYCKKKNIELKDKFKNIIFVSNQFGKGNVNSKKGRSNPKDTIFINIMTRAGLDALFQRIHGLNLRLADKNSYDKHVQKQLKWHYTPKEEGDILNLTQLSLRFDLRFPKDAQQFQCFRNYDEKDSWTDIRLEQLRDSDEHELAKLVSMVREMKTKLEDAVDSASTEVQNTSREHKYAVSKMLQLSEIEKQLKQSQNKKSSKYYVFWIMIIGLIFILSGFMENSMTNSNLAQDDILNKQQKAEENLELEQPIQEFNEQIQESTDLQDDNEDTFQETETVADDEFENLQNEETDEQNQEDQPNFIQVEDQQFQEEVNKESSIEETDSIDNTQDQNQQEPELEYTHDNKDPQPLEDVKDEALTLNDGQNEETSDDPTTEDDNVEFVEEEEDQNYQNRKNLTIMIQNQKTKVVQDWEPIVKQKELKVLEYLKNQTQNVINDFNLQKAVFQDYMDKETKTLETLKNWQKQNAGWSESEQKKLVEDLENITHYKLELTKRGNNTLQAIQNNIQEIKAIKLALNIVNETQELIDYENLNLIIVHINTTMQRIQNQTSILKSITDSPTTDNNQQTQKWFKRISLKSKQTSKCTSQTSFVQSIIAHSSNTFYPNHSLVIDIKKQEKEKIKKDFACLKEQLQELFLSIGTQNERQINTNLIIYHLNQSMRPLSEVIQRLDNKIKIIEQNKISLDQDQKNQMCDQTKNHQNLSLQEKKIERHTIKHQQAIIKIDRISYETKKAAFKDLTNNLDELDDTAQLLKNQIESIDIQSLKPYKPHREEQDILGEFSNIVCRRPQDFYKEESTNVVIDIGPIDAKKIVKKLNKTKDKTKDKTKPAQHKLDEQKKIKNVSKTIVNNLTVQPQKLVTDDGNQPIKFVEETSSQSQQEEVRQLYDREIKLKQEALVKRKLDVAKTTDNTSKLYPISTNKLINQSTSEFIDLATDIGIELNQQTKVFESSKIFTNITINNSTCADAPIKPSYQQEKINEGMRVEPTSSSKSIIQTSLVFNKKCRILFGVILIVISLFMIMCGDKKQKINLNTEQQSLWDQNLVSKYTEETKLNEANNDEQKKKKEVEKEEVSSQDSIELKYPIPSISAHRQDVIKLPQNLKNICSVLEQAFKMVKAAEGGNLLVCLGNTGCGKSTMLTSLVYGTDALEEKIEEIEIAVEQPDKTVKYKNKKRVRIVQTEELEHFKIGHNETSSETFVPHIYLDEASGTTFVDFAGFNDTSGDFVDLINSLIDRHIFLRARQVRFLILLTVPQILNNRGSEVKTQLDAVMKMCGKNLRESAEAIQPVLTKMRQSDQEDLDDLRSTLHDQLQLLVQQEFQNQCNKRRQVTGQSELSESEKQEIEEQVGELKAFFESISEKLEIYDPLDREIMGGTNENMATKRADFLKIVNEELRAMDSKAVHAPLSNKLYQYLLKQFDGEQEKCNEVVKGYLAQAEEQGELFQDDIAQNAAVIQFRQILQFFNKNKLLPEAEQRVLSFRKFLERSKQMIKEAQNFHKMNQDKKEVYTCMKRAHEYQTARDYESLAKALIALSQAATTLKNKKQDNLEQQSGCDLMSSKGYRCIEDIVTAIQQDKRELLAFAYQLLKVDTEQKYAYDFLNGQVKPHILTTIICSNVWSPEEKKMKLKEAGGFIFLGEMTLLAFPAASQSDNRLTMNDSDSLRDNNLAKIQLLLCASGVKIINKNRMVAADGPELNAATSSQAVSDPGIYHERPNATWTMVPVEQQSEDSYFYLELNQGETKPRLTRVRNSAKHIHITTKESAGYSDPKLCVWKVFQFHQ